ncbi:uncharacterized protein METZ01_LOCUS107066 [marine metagenome]|uniref:Uncharacterized protein n=1 Tax=marine metagenome TaxID=408172 RepID=A0A381WP81_9ZZZZ
MNYVVVVTQEGSHLTVCTKQDSNKAMGLARIAIVYSLHG